MLLYVFETQRCEQDIALEAIGDGRKDRFIDVVTDKAKQDKHTGLALEKDARSESLLRLFPTS